MIEYSGAVPKCNCPFHIRAEFWGKIGPHDTSQNWSVIRESYTPEVIPESETYDVRYTHYVALRAATSHIYVVACGSIRHGAGETAEE